MIEVLTTYYPITPTARETYEKLKRDHRCLFMNSGSLKDSSDEWTMQNITFETDIPDNIASKNPYFNELTAWLAAWKVLERENTPDEEWIQTSHYRKRLQIDSSMLKESSVLKDVKADVFCTHPYPMRFSSNGRIVPATIESGFKICHPSIGWTVMESVVKEMGSWRECSEWDTWKTLTTMPAPINTYAMRYGLLKTYWTWLYERMNAIEERMPKDDPAYKTAYQSRWGGFLSERLFSFWCWSRGWRGEIEHDEVPLVIFNGFKPFGDGDERRMTIEERERYFR